MSVPAKFDSLDVQQAQFVALFLERGGHPADAVAAAMQAGFGSTEKDARRAAAILLGTPAIASAIKSDVSCRFGALSAIALDTIVDLCRNGTPSVRLAAARELLDRGVGPVASRNAVLHATVSVEDLLEAIDLECEDAAQVKTIKSSR